MLEWGHSLYFDKNGELTNSRHDLSDEFLNGVSQTNILKKIQDERESIRWKLRCIFWSSN